MRKLQLTGPRSVRPKWTPFTETRAFGIELAQQNKWLFFRPTPLSFRQVVQHVRLHVAAMSELVNWRKDGVYLFAQQQVTREIWAMGVPKRPTSTSLPVPWTCTDLAPTEQDLQPLQLTKSAWNEQLPVHCPSVRSIWFWMAQLYPITEYWINTGCGLGM